jgi:hypothetical protein
MSGGACHPRNCIGGEGENRARGGVEHERFRGKRLEKGERIDEER